MHEVYYADDLKWKENHIFITKEKCNMLNIREGHILGRASKVFIGFT
jgi:hypothetical protein